MTKFISRLVAIATVIATGAGLTGPLAARSDSGFTGITVITPAQSARPGEVRGEPVELVSFNYPRFFNRAHQLGLTTQNLGFTLAVDAQGKVTGCELARDFRNRFTEREVCRKLASNIRLNPARDAAGTAVSGTFQGEVMILSYFTPDR